MSALKLSTPKKGKYQNKQVYLNAALNLIREVGIEKLTMRRMAKDLDVSPMAIYKHFANKEELLKAVLDEFIARAEVLPTKELTWDAWLDHVARGMYGALRGEPLWLPFLGSLDVGENALTITAAFIGKMTAAGFSVEESLDAYLAMIHIVIGAVSLQSAFDKGGARVSRNMADNLEEHAENLMAISVKQQIDISLPLLLEGLRNQLSRNH
ncbi:MAG: TetR family transcriptional regulator [Pseudomonadales bacterium]|nr:TetR family transcriptional regulator [Pseudomonadales bacterium]